MTRQYIGARYVPKFYENSDNTSEWRSGVEYEPLTIVTWNGNSYTSKKTVPSFVGEPNLNSNYWAATGLYNAQIQELTNAIEPIVKHDNYLFNGDEIYVDDVNTQSFVSGNTYIFKNDEFDVSAPIVINANNIKLVGNGTVINNPVNNFVFKVIGDNVEICGFVINNNSPVYDVERRTEDDYYGAIMVIGTGANIHHNEINRVNKTGIYLNGSGEVHHNIIDGKLVRGVYDAVSLDNQQDGIYTRNNNRNDEIEVYNNICENLICGIIHGGFLYDANHNVKYAAHDNFCKYCVDHCLYINGGAFDNIYNNVSYYCGGIAVQALRRCIVRNNIMHEGFSNSDMSLVETPVILDIREPHNSNISGNTIKQTNITNHSGRGIYLHHFTGSSTEGATGIFENITINNNYVEYVSGTALCVGSDATTKLLDSLINGNTFKINTPYSSFTCVMFYSDVENTVICDNIFEFVTSTNYGIQLGNVTRSQFNDNIFNDTYGNEAAGRTLTQTGVFTNCKIRGNKTNGCLLTINANDTIDIIGNIVKHLPLANALANIEELNVAVRQNTFNDNASKTFKLTTNASGNASIQGAFIPGMAFIIETLDNTPISYSAKVGTNGWLSIFTDKASSDVLVKVV